MKALFQKKIARILGIVIMLFFYLSINAQNTTKRNLNNQIKKSSIINLPDTFKNTQDFIDVSINLARSKWRQNDDSTLILLYEIENIIKKINESEYLGVIEEEKGVYHSVNRRFIESIPFFKNAILHNNKYSKNNKLAYNYRNIAISKHHLNENDSAYYYGYMSLIELDSTQGFYELYSGLTHKSLSDIMYHMGLAKRSINYADKAYNDFIKINRKYDAITALVTKAANYIDIEDDSDSIKKDEIFELLLHYLHPDSLTNALTTIPIHANLGFYYTTKREYDKALFHLNEAKLLCFEENRRFYLTTIYPAISRVYINKKDAKNAKLFLDLSLEVNEEFQNVNSTYAILSAQSEYYYLTKNYKLANNYADSIISERNSYYKTVLDNNIQIIELEVYIKQNKRDIELLKIENILMNEKLKVKDIQRSFLTYILIIVALFISIFIIQFVKIKKTNNKLKVGRKFLSTANMELKLLNERKNGLISIIGHDLRNPLMNASSLLEFIPSEADKISEESSELLFLAKSSLSNTRELLENLLIWAKVQKDNISYEYKKHRLFNQIRFIIDLYENQIVQKQISIINQIGEDHEATFDLNSFQTIIRNLINNAVKFAPEKSEIHLYSEYRENALLVVIEDQAGGFPEPLLADLNSEKSDVFEKNQIQANGLGLQLVKEFTSSNKIKFQVENTTLGSRISLLIPV